MEAHGRERHRDRRGPADLNKLTLELLARRGLGILPPPLSFLHNI